MPASIPIWFRGLGGPVSRLYFNVGRRFYDHKRELAFRSLSSSQWWPRERLEQEQWRSLKRLLEHAHAHVPFYRDRFANAGVNPNDITSPADFARLPVLTKQDIQTHGPAMRATLGYQPDHAYVNHTGGSTGTPLTFWQDASYRAWGMADIDRNFAMCGYRPGWRQAFLWGSDYDAKPHTRLKGRLADLLLNRLWINTFDLNVTTLRQAVQQLVAFRPQLLVGYVSSLTMLARVIREERLVAPRPIAVQTSAEVLTPAGRKLIEETLQAPCFDRYGCREVGNIAHECEAHSGLHLLTENNYTEFGENGTSHSAEPKAIIVTNLRNYAMPFIRYVNGDLAVPSGRQCSCGRGLPLMERLQGRTSDVIQTPGGRFLHGEFFTHLLYGVPGVLQFQVEQLTLPDLVVRLVTDSEDSYRAAQKHLTGLILEHGDPAFRCRFERVSHIAPLQSGKYRFTLSHVSLSFSGKSSDALA